MMKLKKSSFSLNNKKIELFKKFSDIKHFHLDYNYDNLLL